MKKIISLVFIVLVAGVFTHAQQAWVDHKVDGKVSVKFPLVPKEIQPGTFMAVVPDSSVVYICTHVDFAQVAGLDEATLSPMETTPEFLAQLKSGLKQSLPDVNLADFSLGTFKGYNSYTTSGLDSKNKKYDMFMFIIGTDLYSLSTVSKSGKTAEKEKFLSSIAITK